MNYRIGQRFLLVDPDVSKKEYILCCPSKDNLVLINLENGNRWSNSKEYKGCIYNIPEDFLEELFVGDGIRNGVFKLIE